MNQFTKEELEYIQDCVDFGLMDKQRNDNFLYLDDKIQAMIDNYKPPCEHKRNNMAYAYLECERCYVRKELKEELQK
jgi:hypothetical protein